MIQEPRFTFQWRKCGQVQKKWNRLGFSKQGFATQPILKPGFGCKLFHSKFWDVLLFYDIIHLFTLCCCSTFFVLRKLWQNDKFGKRGRRRKSDFWFGVKFLADWVLFFLKNWLTQIVINLLPFHKMRTFSSLKWPWWVKKIDILRKKGNVLWNCSALQKELPYFLK